MLQISVRAARIVHKVPCWGYVVEEPSSPGRLDVEKCIARGLQPGPIYQKLKKGEPALLPDGTLVQSPFIPTIPNVLKLA